MINSLAAYIQHSPIVTLQISYIQRKSSMHCPFVDVGNTPYTKHCPTCPGAETFLGWLHHLMRRSAGPWLFVLRLDPFCHGTMIDPQMAGRLPQIHATVHQLQCLPVKLCIVPMALHHRRIFVSADHAAIALAARFRQACFVLPGGAMAFGTFLHTLIISPLS